MSLSSPHDVPMTEPICVVDSGTSDTSMAQQETVGVQSSSDTQMESNDQMDVDYSVLQPPEEGEQSSSGMPCEIYVCPNVEQSDAFSQALQSFGIPFVFSNSVDSCLESNSKGPIVIVSSIFPEGPVNQKVPPDTLRLLHKPPLRRLLGPTALIELEGNVENLAAPPKTKIRPLFCQSMQNVVVCVTGFNKVAEATVMIDRVKHMGGKLRKEMNYQVTHLIANCASGEKYKYAHGFRVPIVNAMWVEESWEKRFEPHFKACEPSFMSKFKLTLFQGMKINFFGFSEEDEAQLHEMLNSNGGEVSHDSMDPLTTHVVVDDSKVTSMPKVNSADTPIVKARWFWMSIQNQACVDECKFRFGKNFRTPDRAAKRKRIVEYVEEPQFSPRKSRKKKSDIGGAPRQSCGSLLDYTTSPDNILSMDESDDPKKPSTPRFQVFKELCQTESNYVSVLNILIEHFKNPLEEKTSSGDSFLNPAELKIIFGDLVPIYEIHQDLLRDLKYLEQHYTESTSIGDVFVKFCPNFKKAYPPYINFFQDANELLKEKEKNNPRFYAFLKLCYMNLRELQLPEIDRQALPDLLIRPVQRLGSISLLLNDIKKNTSKTSPDHQKLSEALDGIRTVMTFMNENKQRNDNQRSLFDIYQDIENCPPQLINSQRSFVLKCDVIELSNVLSNRGDCVTLFLFSDVVEVCKKRSRYMNILKSPRDTNASKLSLSTYKTPAKHIEKTYKHLQLLSMTSIRKVYNVVEDKDDDKKEDNVEHDKNIFALRCRESDEKAERTYSFSMMDDNIDKMHFLKELSRQFSIVYCTNFNTVLSTITLSQASAFQIETSENSHSTLGKALKYASKQVGRTFNLNRTPSTLRRVMSSMKVRATDT